MKTRTKKNEAWVLDWNTRIDNERGKIINDIIALQPAADRSKLEAHMREYGNLAGRTLLAEFRNVAKFCD